jgi:hypothetical protein
VFAGGDVFPLAPGVGVAGAGVGVGCLAFAAGVGVVLPVEGFAAVAGAATFFYI